MSLKKLAHSPRLCGIGNSNIVRCCEVLTQSGKLSEMKK